MAFANLTKQQSAQMENVIAQMSGQTKAKYKLQEEGVEISIDHLVAIMGPTGSGKSTFINLLLGENKMKVGHGVDSCTENIAHAVVKIEGKHVLLVDTPGFDDTTLSDTEILKRIAAWLELTYKGNEKLSGVIYLYDITADRMKGSAKKNLVMFRKLVGRDGLRNVILATTMWSKMSEPDHRAEGLKRQQELCNGHWAGLLKKGSLIVPHDNGYMSAKKMIYHIIGLEEVVLAIQKELVDEKKDLIATAAGAEINREVLAETAKKDKEKEEMAKAHSEEQRALQQKFNKATQDANREIEAIKERERQGKISLTTMEREIQDTKDDLADARKEKEEADEEIRKEKEDYQRELREWQKQQNKDRQTMADYKTQVVSLSEQVETAMQSQRGTRKRDRFMDGLVSVLTFGHS